MRKLFFCSFLTFLLSFNSFAQRISEKYIANQTPTYQEVIAFYKVLDKKYPNALMEEKGTTDIGKPLHLFLISDDKDFDLASIRKKNKRILLINNAIHPGEPDGVDASMKLAEDLLSNQDYRSLLKNTVIAIIPVYNIDGALNRGCCSRANQNGPEQYGFRGNAKNLDLNRDFIKCDAQNTMSFTKIFQELKPDVLVDTHVSDGADYQYTMTLIATQHNKLQPLLGNYLKKQMLPKLYEKMKIKNCEMTPYVDALHETPDDGIAGFLETPRFSTGYAALFNTIGFVTETHMFKAYKDRVLSTHQFLLSLLELMNDDAKMIGELRVSANQQVSVQDTFALAWQLDTSKHEIILFKGYEAKYKPSNISGKPRLYYDRQAIYEKPIRFYDEYKVIATAIRPEKYIIPQAWKTVVERLEWNDIHFIRLDKDSLINVEAYYFTDYDSPKKPYEGHFLHHKLMIRKEQQQTQYYKGDYVVELNQASNRYIMETLEPQATDSYFAWNFFDSVLQQKEGFSDYVFEEQAEELLEKNPELKKSFSLQKKIDPEFAGNHRAQLEYIYQQSQYFEKSVMRYPITRVNRSR